MIRYAYICHTLLQLYRQLPNISFPLDLDLVIAAIPNCRYLSYQDMAEISGITLNDVINVCESRSGCTHYDTDNKRYLIMCNHDDGNIGRQRWTCAHEIGHIACEHHTIHRCLKLSENSILQISDRELELEADYFAGMLLAPFPIFDALNIRSPADVQKVFGLSTEASYNRYNQFLRWKTTKVKTAWENDMIRLYKLKS